MGGQTPPQELHHKRCKHGCKNSSKRLACYFAPDFTENSPKQPFPEFDWIRSSPSPSTNKAAAEMAERVDKLLGHGSLAKPLLSTFHSFCVRLLRRDIESPKIGGEGLTRAFSIYDESNQQLLVKQVMRQMGLDDRQLTPKTVLSRISWAKNHMLDPQKFCLQSTDPTSEKVARIFEAYSKELRKANALDFDDLLLEAVRVLASSKEVRDRYNRRYRYLLIDEYQDTNRPQYELMKLLAGPEKNVCAVGDEDQSIYSWRGAAA